MHLLVIKNGLLNKLSKVVNFAVLVEETIHGMGDMELQKVIGVNGANMDRNAVEPNNFHTI